MYFSLSFLYFILFFSISCFTQALTNPPPNHHLHYRRKATPVHIHHVYKHTHKHISKRFTIPSPNVSNETTLTLIPRQQPVNTKSSSSKSKHRHHHHHTSKKNHGKKFHHGKKNKHGHHKKHTKTKNTKSGKNMNLKNIWSIGSKSISLAAFNILQAAYGMDTIKTVLGPNDISAIKAFYPAGSIDPANKDARGGFGFYASPGKIDYKSSSTVSLSFSVYFQPNFQWNLGGKLPGLFGGKTQCSGGIDAKSAGCFSSRFMWRPNGQGEVYLYIPSNQDSSFWNVGPKTINTGYGISFARGSFSFKSGAWTNIQQIVTLNTPGQNNGVLTVNVNGKQVIHFDKMNYREDDIPFMGTIIETFFGGHGTEYASPQDQYALFGKFSLGAK